MRELIIEAMEEARERWDFDEEDRLWLMLMTLDNEEEEES